MRIARHPRLAWAFAQSATAAAWWFALPHLLRQLGLQTERVALQAAAWALVAALLHGLLGIRLLRAGTDPERKSATRDPRIHGGLKVLALRYFTGVGLVLVGLMRFPEHTTVFVIAWSGLYLILIVSEVIVFSRGVNRL